ncbi:MAG: hypothetical protein RIQ56_807 [Candidatus Parcubacteria bacterium]|jgi:hypothetical protein
MIRRYFPKDMRELTRWYERYISPVSLVAGFLADNFILLKRVDVLHANLLLFFYLFVAAFGIILLNAIQAGKVQQERILKFSPLIPICVQFAFGGLFSGYLSLYSRSVGLFQSWVFVVALAALLIGNERFTRLYTKFSFQITLYFTVLFSFFIFFLPVVFRQIGPAMFLLSGATSLAAISLLLFGLSRISPQTERAERKTVIRSIGSIFLIFVFLYFSNLIPPLPLALKEAGVYHEVTRNKSGTYLLTKEVVSWYESLLYTETFHKTNLEDVYVFTSIFAPSGLTTPILHEWQQYDPASRTWKTKSTVTFSIVGGRDGGYRGYSQKSGVTEGSWRVNVLTQYGAVIGRVRFDVVSSEERPRLVTEEE